MKTKHFICSLFFILTYFICTPEIYADNFEMYFMIRGSDNSLLIRTVTLYKVSGDQLNQIASGSSKNFTCQRGSNGACDIEGNDGTTLYPTQAIWSPLYNFEAGEYVITCDGYYIKLGNYILGIPKLK